MITSSHKTSYQYLRKIMVLPVAVIVVALFAFSYKNKKANVSLSSIEKPVTVVIDAGHGVDPTGAHTGAVAPDGSHEDDIVLSIAKKIKELNTNDRLQIVLTRENKDIVDLKKRVEFSNLQNADLFISLHANAASTQEKNTEGMDILLSGKNTKYYAENKILAAILYNYFHQIHSINDIQQSKNGVYVIDNRQCPSVLVECGYLTDPNDLAFVKDETSQAQIAKSILQSIEQYFLQKELPDWEERKRTVSDTAWPVIIFNRNTVSGKMEGSYNGKKFTKMTNHEGQFVFLFDDDSSTTIFISKEQTEVLKKQYGNNLNELIIKDHDKQKVEEKEQVELKETLEEKQLEMEKAEFELKQLIEQEQVAEDKEQFQLKQLMTLKQYAIEQEQQEFKKMMDTMQNKDKEEAMKKFKLSMDYKQRHTEAMQKSFELKRLEAKQNSEEIEKMMMMKQQEVEKNKKELKKMLLEKQKESEEKSKTHGKKVKT